MSLSSQQLQFQLLGSSGPGAVAAVLAVLASKSSNLITVVTVGCHTLDA